MRIYVAYRFTGADHTALRADLDAVCRGLTAAGHEPVCTLDNIDHFTTHRYTVSQVMWHGLDSIHHCDGLLALVSSSDKSEGLLIEAGYALALGKPVVVARQRNAHIHSLGGVADVTLEWETIPELENTLALLSFPTTHQPPSRN